MSDYLECDEARVLDDLLTDNMDFLARRIKVQDIFSRLRTKRAISQSDQEEIEAKITNIEKNVKLIDTVRRNGLQAMKTFMMCLEYDYADVYIRVAQKTPSDPPPDWPEEIRKSMARESIKSASRIIEELRKKDKNKDLIEALQMKLIDLQQQIISRADECLVKQQDITKLVMTNKEIQEENKELKKKLNDAENVKDKFMKEMNSLRWFNQPTHMEAQGANSTQTLGRTPHQGLSMDEDLDPFQQMLTERDTYRAKVTELESKLESMRVKTEKQEEKRSVAENIKTTYQDKCENLQRELSQKGGTPCASASWWHTNQLYMSVGERECLQSRSEIPECNQLEPYSLHYPELKEWNLYHEVSDKLEIEVEIDYLKDIGLIGGNLCGVYVDCRPSYNTKLNVADEILKITLEERCKIKMAVQTTTYDMSGVCLDSVKLMVDRMPDTGLVTITKQSNKTAHQIITNLTRKGSTGGDCFCINILQGHAANASGDLKLDPGMIVLTTYTDYKESTLASSHSRRYWYGHVLNPENGDEIGKKGRFPSLIGAGRLLRRQGSSNAERMEFRYVYPCRVKHKRPVAILSSEKCHVSVLKTLADSDFFHFCDSEHRESSYDNIVLGVSDHQILHYSEMKKEKGSFRCLTLTDLQDIIQQKNKHVLLSIDVEAIGRMVRAKMTPIVIVVKQKGDDTLEVEKSLQNHLILQPYEYRTLELSSDVLASPTELRTHVSTLVSEIQRRLVWIEHSKPVEPF